MILTVNCWNTFVEALLTKCDLVCMCKSEWILFLSTAAFLCLLAVISLFWTKDTVIPWNKITLNVCSQSCLTGLNRWACSDQCETLPCSQSCLTALSRWACSDQCETLPCSQSCLTALNRWACSDQCETLPCSQSCLTALNRWTCSDHTLENCWKSEFSNKY